MVFCRERGWTRAMFERQPTDVILRWLALEGLEPDGSGRRGPRE